MEKQTHEIETIEDIFDVVTEDNFDRFMTDFYVFVAQIAKVKREIPDVEIKTMKWTDDGIHKITGVTINGDEVNFKKTDKDG